MNITYHPSTAFNFPPIFLIDQSSDSYIQAHNMPSIFGRHSNKLPEPYIKCHIEYTVNNALISRPPTISLAETSKAPAPAPRRPGRTLQHSTGDESRKEMQRWCIRGQRARCRKFQGRMWTLFLG